MVDDRVPPHDLRGEQVLVSALVLTPDAFDLVQGIIRPDQLYDQRNRLICEAVWGLQEANQPVDMEAVARWLDDRKKLQEAGGTPYLAQTIDATPAVANVDSHAAAVAEKWRIRQLILACKKTAALASASTDTSEDQIEVLEKDLAALRAGVGQKTLEPVWDIANRHLHTLEAAKERGDGLLGVPTGLVDLDALMAGLSPGDTTIVAGRPGMGKTSFVTNLCEHIATPTKEEPGYAVALFSLEMPREQLALRLICSRAGVDHNEVRRNRLSADGWQRLWAAIEELRHMALYIDDTSSITLGQIRSRVRRLKSQIALGTSPIPSRRLALVAVDYLQLMENKAATRENREQQISSISRGMKQLAKEESVHVMPLSQLNRGPEKDRKDKRPQLSDLRECFAPGSRVWVVGEGWVRIEELVDRSFDVLGVNHGLEVCAARATAWVTREKQVVEVTTAHGQRITVSRDHPLRDTFGWIRADLLLGQQILVASDLHPGAEVRWSEVVSIEDRGIMRCYDLEVDGIHNAIVDGVFAHNSGAIEQDADNVLFIYRPCYYDKGANKRDAEVIVAKQRNGPTKTVEVIFEAVHTRFSNKAHSTGGYAGDTGPDPYGDDEYDFETSL